MNKNEVKGVTANKKSPVVVPQPDRPERQFMSKDDVLKAKELEKKANEAADAARAKVLADHGQTIEESNEDKVAAEKEQKIALVKRQLANAQKKLDENPKSKSWAAKVQNLSQELEVLES